MPNNRRFVVFQLFTLLLSFLLMIHPPAITIHSQNFSLSFEFIPEEVSLTITPHIDIVVNLTITNLIRAQGSVENLLVRSPKIQLLDGPVVPLDHNSKNIILQALHEMSTGALCCLGFAYKDELPDFETYDGNEDHPAQTLILHPSNYASIESKLTFVSLVGLRDPPREEVSQAMENCRAGGIRIKERYVSGKNFCLFE